MKATELEAHHTVTELHNRYRRAKQPVERSRWHMVWLKRKGKSIAEIMEQTGYGRSTISALIRDYNARGEAAIRDRRQDNGSAPALNEAQQQQLLEALEKPPAEGGFWSGPAVRRYVQQAFGVQITDPCAWGYFKRLGYSLHRPRPRHVQAAGPEAQEAFKKNYSSKGRLRAGGWFRLKP